MNLSEYEQNAIEGPFKCWECQYVYDYLDLDKIGDYCPVCGKSIQEIEQIYEQLNDK